MNKLLAAFVITGAILAVVGVVSSINVEEAISNFENEINFSSSLSEEDNSIYIEKMGDNVLVFEGGKVIAEIGPGEDGANGEKGDSKGVMGSIKEATQGMDSGLIASIITLCFGIFAFTNWIHYISKFDPKRALPDLLIPSVATFLAFKWQTLLGWFSLGGPL